jgi:hypothetical protein
MNKAPFLVHCRGRSEANRAERRTEIACLSFGEMVLLSPAYDRFFSFMLSFLLVKRDAFTGHYFSSSSIECKQTEFNQSPIENGSEEE